MAKNEYKIDLDDLVLRRAKISDNMEDIASLIYQTDPYIYPFWFNEDESEAKRVLSKEILNDGFIYYYENIYVAYSPSLDKIIGIICAIDPTSNLEYDYSKLMSVNNRYKFTIEHYVMEIIKEVKEKKYMYLVNVSVDINYRSRKIGTNLLTYFIKQMHEAGFEEIGFDCLMHNLRAKNLYHSMGFKEVAEGIGFDGTEHSTVEIVFFKKRKGEFVKEDFQMLPKSDVKTIDLEREKYLYDAINKKKQLDNK